MRLETLTGADGKTLIENSYKLLHYTWSLNKAIDKNGKVQSSTRGGIIELIIPYFPSKELVFWAVNNSHSYKSGTIVLCDANDDRINQVRFENADCIGMEVNYSLYGKSFVATKLVISAKNINLTKTIAVANNWIH